MDCDRRRALQKQLELYSGLLKKHETTKKTYELTSVCQLSKSMSWKHPPPSTYKMVKNSTHQFTYSKYASNKFHQSNVTNQNIRTAMYNEANNFKAKYKLTSNKIYRNINSPLNEVKSQKTISNKYPFAQPKSVLSVENASVEAPKMISETSENVSSKSQALIREIESLTEMLKKTSENKSRVISTSGKDDRIVQDKLYNYKTSNKSFKYSASNKFNTVKNKDLFSKNNELTKKQFKIICCDVKPTAALKKNSSSFNQTNPICDKVKHISSLTPPNSFNLNKYSLKNSNKKKIVNSKASCTPLKIVKNEYKSEDNVQMFISESHLQNMACQISKPVADKLSCDVSKHGPKPLTQDSTLDTKLNITFEPALLGKKLNKYPDILKSQYMLKCSGVSKANYAGSKYKRINVVNSITSSKNSQLKNISYLKPSSVKRTKEKLNTKFKIINKIVTPCANKKAILEKSSYGCKENSPLITDKSDPLFKFLNDSTIDKLEHDLLALSTTLTATPISVKNDEKGIQTKFNKMNPKLSHKKMSLKKSKTRVSKYKVVNSVSSPRYTVQNRHSFTNLKNIKKIKSKFSVINKSLQPVHVTPVPQGKSVLIKRLFKSKNAIINKNVYSASHSAKMIKYKYFALNKRKLPYEKPALYLRRPLSLSKFKGYLSPKQYAKKNRYQRTRNLAYNQGTIRRLTHYCGNVHTSVFNRNVSCKGLKKKLRNRYGRPPVVFIRGLKYSLNSSGKTLRKLPIQDFTRIHQKVINNGKRYSRTSENKMKTATPISANLASRVLNRSITRVLSASSKKRLTKVNSYCMFYNRFGRCNRGVKCTYIHDPSKIAVCTRFLRGTCKIDGCPFSHEISPGKMAICSFYLVGACDKENCPYRHENLSTDAELCKAFVQGYCPNGKECKKAHILICPKYIQGSCEKGTSCAFPHPPQKVRKNVQNEIPVEENKQDDALLEKVARYFQPNEDMSVPCKNKSNDNNAANLFVPKQRKLEEQPSFIPLFDSPSSLGACKN